jgi:hypothetical protein
VDGAVVQAAPVSRAKPPHVTISNRLITTGTV